MAEQPGKNYGQTWVERAGVRRRRRRLGDPLPMELQTGFPSDYAVYLPESSNIPAAEAVVQAARRIATLQARQAHAADGGTGNPVRDMLARILARLGTHGQKLTNFRAVVGLTDVVVLPFNPLRAYVFMVNTGAVQINVSMDRGADLVAGIPIPAGGFFEPILGTVSSVHAISTAAAQSLVICEGFYYWGATG